MIFLIFQHEISLSDNFIDAYFFVSSGVEANKIVDSGSRCFGIFWYPILGFWNFDFRGKKSHEKVAYGVISVISGCGDRAHPAHK